MLCAAKPDFQMSLSWSDRIQKMVVSPQRGHVTRSRRVQGYIGLHRYEELTLLGVSALAERPRIGAAAQAKEQSVFQSKRQIQFRLKVLGFRLRIRKNRWCTLFGSWSIIYDFPLQLSHWVERFFLSKDFIYPNIKVSAIHLLLKQTSLLDYSVFPLETKRLFQSTLSAPVGARS